MAEQLSAACLQSPSPKRQKKRQSFGSVCTYEFRVGVGGCGVPETGPPVTFVGPHVAQSTTHVDDVASPPSAADAGGPRRFEPLTMEERRGVARATRSAHEHEMDPRVASAMAQEVRQQRVETADCGCKPVPPPTAYKWGADRLRAHLEEIWVGGAVPEAPDDMPKPRRRYFYYEKMKEAYLVRPACTDPTTCRCARDGGPCCALCSCMRHVCGNPCGALQPRATGVDVDVYRRTIIDATIETGDLFSPGKSNARFKAGAAAGGAAGAGAAGATATESPGAEAGADGAASASAAAAGATPDAAEAAGGGGGAVGVKRRRSSGRAEAAAT